MGKAKWSFESASTIRNDIKDAYIVCTQAAMCDTACNDEYKVHLLEGMMMLFNALKPYTEEPKDEDVQND